MKIPEAQTLIKDSIKPGQKQHWADLGCGAGIFTSALAALLPAESMITAIDNAPQQLPTQMGNRVGITFQKTDFVTTHLQIPPLDGILMANSLHFVKDKKALIRKLEDHFIGESRWLIVEYDHTQPNRWAPYPINFSALKNLFGELGYGSVQKLGERASVYGGNIYSALIF